MTRALFALACCAVSTACSGTDRPAAPRAAALPTDWRRVATEADRDRLRSWRTAWLQGLDGARASGSARDLTSHGALLQPDLALAGALPPAGDYRCRVVKLGAKAGGPSAYTAYPYFDCRIDDEGEVLSFYKLTGSQRPVGLIFRDTDQRGVFLGTLVLGDETSALQYGQDATRDMAGLVERIGERRWRLVLPSPAFESLVDVIELVPAAD